jgi:hypothetical protein
VSLPRDDLDLIDALVWAGCLSRPVAREVAANAEPGRVATYIAEKGLAPAISPPQVIVRALLAKELAERDLEALMSLHGRDPKCDRCGRRGFHVCEQPETD